jgi:hypothetical protein
MLRLLARWLSPRRTGTKGLRSRFTRFGRRPVAFRPRLEVFEDRSLLSTNFPLDLVNWTALGPAPLLSGPAANPEANSGRVVAVAAHPTDPNTFYLAAAGGGAWKTTTGGNSWTPLTDNQSTLFMGAIALTPSNPNIVYAGTGEATNGGLSFYGRGVLKSTDGGATWTLLGNAQFNRRAISSIAVHPTDPNLVYVGVNDSPTNGLPGNAGVWRSTDGGINWTQLAGGLPARTVSDVIMDPNNPQILYAAVGVDFGATQNGVYKSINGGNTWAVAGNFPTGAMNSNIGRIRLAIARSNSQVLYASVANQSTGALLFVARTADAGATWTQLAGTPNYMGSLGWYAQALAVDPTNANIVYAGGLNLVRSGDGGNNWVGISVGANGRGPHVDHHGFTFDSIGRLINTNDGGVWRLDNPNPGSILWTNLNNNLQLTQFIGIALHPTNANIAWGGSQDNGTEQFIDMGTLAWTERFGNDGGFVRVDRANPNTVYQTSQYPIGAGFLRRSDNGGLNWTIKTTGINTSDPGEFYIPYIMDPVNPQRLLLGTNRVYETTNRGDLWTPISTPMTAGWTSSRNITALAAAATDVNTIYAAAGPQVFVTTNRGTAWNLRSTGLPGGGDITDILVDPTNSQIAYAVREIFGGGHVFRTTDGGMNWTDISGNLADLPTVSIELDVRGAGTADDVVYVGTDTGVFVSNNLGMTWSRLGVGLPNVQVRDLELNKALGILAAGTHGRGMWQIAVPLANSISGVKFNDLNNNGVRDANEPGLAGWTIYLDLNNNGVLNAGEPTRITSASGAYQFTGLAAGPYVVREVLQTGWAQTFPTSGFHMVTLTAGGSVEGRDFGNFQLPPPPPPPPGPPPTPIPPALIAAPLLAVGTDVGNLPHVRAYDPVTVRERLSFYAYDSGYRGGVKVAVGDVNGDRVADVITAAQVGGFGHIKAFDGLTGSQIRSFFAFEGFGGVVSLAAGDVNGDGFADFVVGALTGGPPHVKVFDGRTSALIMSFYAFDPDFGGGVQVAAGDLNNDGRADIITAVASHGPPHVKVFRGPDGQLLASFLAYDPGYLGGVTVSAGVQGGQMQIITGTARGGAHVKVFGLNGATRSSFLLGPQDAINFADVRQFQSVVRLAAVDINNDGTAELFTSFPPGGEPGVTFYVNLTSGAFRQLMPYGPGFRGGIHVAAGR